MVRSRRNCPPKCKTCIVQLTILLSLTTSPKLTGRLEPETADLIGILKALPQSCAVPLQSNQGFKRALRLCTQTKLERHTTEPTVGFDATRIGFNGRPKMLKGRLRISKRIRLVSQPVLERSTSSRI